MMERCRESTEGKERLYTASKKREICCDCHERSECFGSLGQEEGF